MSIEFADSSFYVALLIARDANHGKALTIARSWTGSILTTEYVLIEVGNFLSGSPAHRAKFGQLLGALNVDPATEIVEASHAFWTKGTDRFLQRPDKEWSLTDCLSFVLMEERGLNDAFTTDHHFQQAGFTALLA